MNEQILFNLNEIWLIIKLFQLFFATRVCKKSFYQIDEDFTKFKLYFFKFITKRENFRKRLLDKIQRPKHRQKLAEKNKKQDSTILSQPEY